MLRNPVDLAGKCRGSNLPQWPFPEQELLIGYLMNFYGSVGERYPSPRPIIVTHIICANIAAPNPRAGDSWVLAALSYSWMIIKVGSFPKQRDPNIDPNPLYRDPQYKVPLILGNPHIYNPEYNSYSKL